MMNKGTRILLVLALASTLIAVGCKKEETATSETAAAATTTAVAESTGIAECDSYFAAVDKYMQCEKVPQVARDAQKQAREQMRAGWSSWQNLPEESRKVGQDSAKASCTTALTSLKVAAGASGCPVE
jgi:hypothetical protein